MLVRSSPASIIARTLPELDLPPGSTHHPVSPLSSSIVCFPFVPLLDVAHRPCFLLHMGGTIQGKYNLPSPLRGFPPNSRHEFPCRRSKSNGSPPPDHRHCEEARSLLHLSRGAHYSSATSSMKTRANSSEGPKSCLPGESLDCRKRRRSRYPESTASVEVGIHPSYIPRRRSDRLLLSCNMCKLRRRHCLPRIKIVLFVLSTSLLSGNSSLRFIVSLLTRRI